MTLYDDPVAALVGHPVTSEQPIIETRGLGRDYPMGSSVVHALRGVDLRVQRREIVVVRGRSGSGKTTLLSLLGGLDRPTTGQVLLDGESVGDMRPAELIAMRRRRIGFIFQAFGLLSILSAAENVEVPLRLVGADARSREERVAVLLELVELGERARHRPHELSGGEQQRVAIARALANRPDVLIADEPTGQLDSGTGRTIMSLLRSIVQSEGLTAIIATHDAMVIDLADRVIGLEDGRIVDAGA